MFDRLTGSMATEVDKNLFFKNILVLLAFNADEVVSMSLRTDKTSRAIAVGVQVDQQLNSSTFFELSRNQALFVKTKICPDKQWSEDFINYVNQEYRYKETKSAKLSLSSNNMLTDENVDNHLPIMQKRKEETELLK